MCVFSILFCSILIEGAEKKKARVFSGGFRLFDSLYLHSAKDWSDCIFCLRKFESQMFALTCFLSERSDLHKVLFADGLDSARKDAAGARAQTLRVTQRCFRQFDLFDSK